MSKLLRGSGVRVRGSLALVTAALLLLVPACGPSGDDICDLKCDCEGCSDAQYDDCVYESDIADRRGCVDFYDDLLACEDDTGRCHGGDWDTSCGHERDRYHDCIK